MTSPCPADGAVLHAVEVSFDADGGYYTTGRCENCGEQLHEEGERYEPPERPLPELTIDWEVLMDLLPGRRAWHRRAP